MAPETHLAGRVAVVTGGSSGIGKSICQTLGRNALRVVVVGRNEKRCRDVADEISTEGGQALAIPTDVTDPQAVRKLMDQTVGQFGRVDILVNNAGLYDNHRLLDVTDDAWRGVLESSLTGTFLCSRDAYRIMKDQGAGHIVQIASQAAGWPGANEIAYGTVKTGQVKFTLHLQDEFKRAETEANATGALFAHAICPGGVDTPLQRNLGRSEEALATFLRPQDVADLLLEVLRHPAENRNFFETFSADKSFHVGPQGWFEDHENIMRIWK